MVAISAVTIRLLITNYQIFFSLNIMVSSGKLLYFPVIYEVIVMRLNSVKNSVLGASAKLYRANLTAVDYSLLRVRDIY